MRSTDPVATNKSHPESRSLFLFQNVLTVLAPNHSGKGTFLPSPTLLQLNQNGRFARSLANELPGFFFRKETAGIFFVS